MFFFKNYAENEAGRLEGKNKQPAAWFHYISIALTLGYNKNKLQKTLDNRSRDIPNFDFLEKGLGIVSPSHFVYEFSKKCFSCYILLTD